MSRICILDITSTNLDPLSATLTIATIDDITGTIISPPHMTAHGTLDLNSSIALNHQIIKKFQAATYQDRYFGGIKLPVVMATNILDPINELEIEIQSLKDLLDRTLSAESWSKIREGLLQSLNGIDSKEPLRLVIITDNPHIQALPIENTLFIRNELCKGNRPISVIFAPRRQPHKLVWQDHPKILLVLGSQKDIQQPIHSTDIQKHFPSTATFEILKNPTKEDVMKPVGDRAFDIIIIIGHSYTNNDSTDGRININDLDSISIQDFTQPFKNSVNRGLKLVILAGCSSIGAAKALSSENIGVPNVIAFRLPVHYRTLRLFFDRLFKHWIADSQSLEVSLTNTRGELSAIQGNCPGSSISPILFTSPYDPPLKFPIKKLSIIQKIIHISVLRPLLTTKFRGKAVKIPPIALVGLVITTIGYFRWRPPMLQPACNAIQGDRISCGEEILLRQNSISVQQDKQDGANAIANGDFALAVKLLTKAWDAKKDPETSIMLENAKLANPNIPIKSIAITIPGNGSTPSDIPTGMLKAVAFSQQQWNADPNHLWKLQVVIVDDRNNKVEGGKLSEELLKRGIFAGIGSYSSEVTSVVKDVYQQHQTVLIASTSTADRLTNNNLNTYFFRVCSTNQIAGKQIANYLKNHKYNKIVLFHTPGKIFSDSMTAALKANIQGIDIVKEFNFEGKGNPADYLEQAKISGAQAIVLIPDAYTSQDPERDRLLSIVKANDGKLPIIGNEVVKDQTLFNYPKQQLQKLVISLSWHPSSYQNNIINTPNYWGAKAQLDHRIAMTYDATQVLITALDRLPLNLEITKSRQELQKIISNPTFDIGGITGQIGFTGSDRSQTINSLVQPKCDATKCSGFEPAR